MDGFHRLHGTLQASSHQLQTLLLVGVHFQVCNAKEYFFGIWSTSFLLHLDYSSICFGCSVRFSWLHSTPALVLSRTLVNIFSFPSEQLIYFVWMTIGRTPRIDGKEFFRQARWLLIFQFSCVFGDWCAMATFRIFTDWLGYICNPGVAYHMNNSVHF